ncbi:MAG: hypothetical protein U9N12_02495 [Euryarchaeota archaeon]|nr:hypothetical protein [Euryarchaeota archaeon]
MERHHNTHRNTHHNMHPPMFAGMGTTRINGSRIETTEITESHFGGIYDR